MVRFGGARISGTVGEILLRRELVVFVPAIVLAGYWFGLEALILVAGTALAVAWVTRPMHARTAEAEAALSREDGGRPLREEAAEILGCYVERAQAAGRSTTCLVIGIDEEEVMIRQMTRQEFDEVIRRTSERLRGALRENDRVLRLEGARFAIVLCPTAHADLESMIQLAARLQVACEAPLSISARTVAATVHIGFCLLNRSPDPTGAALLEAAETAADEARRNGPSAIRAYSTELHNSVKIRSALASEVAEALEGGQIIAFFQPQLSTDTGQISGMQAVPRWMHRDRGVLTEAHILPAIDAVGLRQRLAEVMLFQSFNALREWARLGQNFGAVSLPVSPELMANPKLAERLKWEFDRFELPPNMIRLVLQQGVVANLNEDVITHNLAACAKLGCEIELAGFGAGPISVGAIRRSSAKRLRIHRSFVKKVDRDPEQQQLVAAMISMAEGLGLSTIAEGVGSLGEHAMLSQLGCNHVQGRAIAAPMPLDETREWAEHHRSKLDATPQIVRRRGP